MILRQRDFIPLESQRANRLEHIIKQFPPVYWIRLDSYRAPEIRQNQRNPDSSQLDPDCRVIGYGAKAPLRLASQPHFWSGGGQESLVNNASESGVGLRSRPRIAKQSRKSRETADGACSNLTASGFFMAPDGSLQPTIR